MNRAEKENVVAQVRKRLEGSQIVVAAHYRGLTVGEMTELRTQLRESGAEMQVVKNTLALRAVAGTGFSALRDLLAGPTAIAFCADPVAPAKVLTEFAKAHPSLAVQGGVLNGGVINTAAISALAKLPAREVLLAKLLGTLIGPIQNLLGVLSAVPGGLVRVLDQIRAAKAGQEAA